MANVVRFKKRSVAASLSNYYARIYSKADGRIIYAGNGLSSDAQGNVTVDIGEAGIHGQHVNGFAGDVSDFVLALGSAFVSDADYNEGDAPLNKQAANILASSVEEGNAVSARKGLWVSNDEITYTYQWKLNGTDISGATTGSILTDESMIDGTLTCVVTATNKYGSTSSTTNSVSVTGEGGEQPVGESNYDNIVFIGASIMYGAFGQDLTTPDPEATTYLNNGTKVYGYGWTGSTYEAVKPKIVEALTAFQGTKTLFVIHAFGNNISGDRPLVDNDESVEKAWNDRLDDVYAITASVRDDCIIADPTFRNYDGTTLYDIDQGSFPYIAEYFTPRRNPRFTNSDGSCILDLHTMVRENNDWLLPDGIHIDDNVAFRAGILDRLKYLTDGSGVKPQPIVQTIPLDDPNKPPATPSDTVIVNFGTSNLSQGFQGTTLTAEAFNAHNTRRLKTGQGFYTNYTMGTFSPSGAAGNNTSNKLLSVQYNDTLLSDPLHEKCIYLRDAEVTFSGFEPNQVVEVSFIATRSGTDNYITSMEEQGNPTNIVEYDTSQVNPSAPTPLIITSDSSGTLTVVFRKVSGLYGYLGAIRINPIS